MLRGLRFVLASGVNRAVSEAAGKPARAGVIVEGAYTTEILGRPFEPLGAVSVRIETVGGPASFEEAAMALVAAAREQGADAVVGVRYEVAGDPNIRYVHAYGTAVRFSDGG